MEKVKAVAGIDIGGTSTTFGFVDRSGKILAGGQIITSQYDKPESFVAALYEKMMITAQNPDYDIEILGFGIGAPMGNINKGTIEYAANLPWKGIVPLADLFARHTPLPVIVTNDANAAAVGEMVFGGARGMKNFVVITLGTGLGSGFVVDGKLVYGHDGFAGELGHTTIRPGRSDRDCGCGRKGCLETYVSATGLKRTVLQLMAERLDDSELRKLSFEELDSKLICEAARRGDPIALEAFEQTGAMLAFSLANVTVHTNPEAIFLFGGLALAGELIFEPTRRHLEEDILYIYRGRVKLLPSELSTQNAAVLGASSLVWFELETA
ncbi:MAG TPA: ROK family protein [Bacteroidales bacterium]|jgi:glucokinase|nr:ROK family protein [Bacteroidales bacterium]HOE25532.1 ROK family protein [Bacteroidales bacterium]HOH14100.1 ROK family protein [Bacteroidales bacterium]HOT17861.1 ROK family protein [Bacteroidales bacterium]HPH75318.1 ROK family protein [Bacteroidales bacterium]